MSNSFEQSEMDITSKSGCHPPPTFPGATPARRVSTVPVHRVLRVRQRTGATTPLGLRQDLVLGQDLLLNLALLRPDYFENTGPLSDETTTHWSTR